MSAKIGGQRPRPRVALLWLFGERDLEQFYRMFPTIWQGETVDGLRAQVDVREVDVMIVGREVSWASDWPEAVHVICFSQELSGLPGPTPNTRLVMSGRAETEGFLLPDIPLPMSRRRDADFYELSSVRGWRQLWIRAFSHRGCPSTEMRSAEAKFNKGAIICESVTNIPLATHYLRHANNLGVAWLPYTPFDQASWVEVLVTQWAQFDKERFPQFGDWTAFPEWMVQEEEDIIASIEVLEQQKQNVMAQTNQRVGELESKLAAARAAANRGRRRLMTAKEDGLVDEVKKVFQDIGFEVDDLDEILGEGSQKREDLRLRDPSGGQGDWEAIVEVVGYGRSDGRTRDLLSIGRFANLYQREKGRLPDKRIYVVNGQLELLPPHRQAPLASAEEDVQVFAESDGLIIWTLDLFRAMKAAKPKDYPTLRESIKVAIGRWIPDTV